MERSEIVDALPFIDTLIDDDEQERLLAMQMVDDELEVFPPDKDYLAILPNISKSFSTSLSQHNPVTESSSLWTSSELSRLKVDVPPPNPTNISILNNEELNLWLKCFNQIKIKLEYRQRQLVNLDLMRTHGSSAWEHFIKKNEMTEASIDQELKEIRDNIQKINTSRKINQEQVLKNLDVLQANWDNLTIGNQMLAEEIEKLNARCK